jgi:predicted SnoaL-like aldol condensation-catalyzing enzyme
MWQRHRLLTTLLVSLIALALLAGVGSVAAAEQRRVDARQRSNVVHVIDALTQDLITHDWDAMGELISPAFVDHAGSASHEGNREGFVTEMKYMTAAVSEAVLTIDDIRVDADIATVRLHVEAQLTTDNDSRIVASSDILMFRVVDGRIAEAW